MRLFRPNVKKLHAAGDVTGLMRVLGDRDSSLRAAARDALIQLGTEAVKPLIDGLRSSVAGTRINAARVLGDIGGHQAVSALIDALSDGFQAVRQDAAASLGRCGDERALAALCQRLNDSHAPTSRNAGCAIVAILLREQRVAPLLAGGDDAKTMFRLLHASPDPQALALERRAIVEGGEAAAPLLEALGTEGSARTCETLMDIFKRGEIAAGTPRCRALVPSLSLRLSEIEAVTDPTLLADIVSAAANPFNRPHEHMLALLAATQRIADQAVLAAAATKPWADGRCLEKLGDQVLLADVARNAYNANVRRSATQKLTDPRLLLDIARNAHDSEVRVAAINKISDDQALAALAKPSTPPSVRAAIVNRLADPSALVAIALQDSDTSTAADVANKLTDAQALLELALAHGAPAVAKLAAAKVTDQRALFRIAAQCGKAVREAVLPRIADTAALDRVVGSLGLDDPQRDTFSAAAEANDLPTIASCLERGTPIDTRNQEGATALVVAAFAGSDALCHYLLDHGALPDARDDRGFTALITACEAKCEQLELARRLLALGANVNARSEHGATALMTAAKIGHSKLVELLLASGAYVNAANAKGMTALIWAAWLGHERVVELLVSSGADLEARERDQSTTALQCAQEGRHDRVAALLVAEREREQAR
jgi:ankyrin repeat protein